MLCKFEQNCSRGFSLALSLTVNNYYNIHTNKHFKPLIRAQTSLSVNNFLKKHYRLRGGGGSTKHSKGFLEII